MELRVAIIGAGAAGLAAARRASQHGFQYVVFEQSSVIGGTWVYDSRVDKDEYGYPIHSSMYQNLSTNLPKEIMAFPDFPIVDEKRSYVSASVILQYLNDYATAFKIQEKIKFNCRVTSVWPDTESKPRKWHITYCNLPTSVISTETFDAVMVCNGHYHTPNTPKILGLETFPGRLLHSHNYRKPEEFVDETVVVVGAGPSGLDIALDVSAVAKKVYLSHHNKESIESRLRQNVYFKPDIEKIANGDVYFVDGSVEPASVLLLCTGYLYSFPFLDETCGVTVRENHVSPLYKHLIAINNPTLCFVGLPFYVCANAMFDLQVRFFIATLKGDFQLPKKEEMLLDEQNEMAKRRAMGLSPKQSHQMGPLQGQYYEDLATTANIEGIPPVFAKLHNESSRRFLEDVANFRRDRYRIIDSQHYEEIDAV